MWISIHRLIVKNQLSHLNTGFKLICIVICLTRVTTTTVHHPCKYDEHAQFADMRRKKSRSIDSTVGIEMKI